MHPSLENNQNFYLFPDSMAIFQNVLYNNEIQWYIGDNFQFFFFLIIGAWL